MTHPRSYRLPLLLFVLTSGCAVGPNFHRPPAPEVTGYLAPAVSQPSSIGPQILKLGAEVPAEWWRAFGSRKLDALVTEALKNNSDLAAAHAAVSAARQTYLAQTGVLLPTADASVASTRAKSSEYLSPPLNGDSFYYTLQTAELDLNYTLDLFGGLRRQVEGAKAQAEAQRFETEGTRLTLISNVVVAALQQASLQEEVSFENRIIEVETQILKIMRQQLQLGQISRADVLLQEAALAQAQTNLPPLQKALTVQNDLLAYLIGKAPGQVAPPSFTMADFTLPDVLPLSLPSKLVEQRPDIRVAEANLHVASAAVGVAVAARLPTFALQASGGGNGARFATLFSRGDNFWSYGTSITQPLFEGGQLLHKERSARASLVQAQELYRSAVLTAFQNVADTLQALQVDERALAFAQASQKAAASSLEIARKQQEAGQIAGVTVLTTEQALRAADVTLIGAEAARFTDTAALFQALGGGWWSESPGRT